MYARLTRYSGLPTERMEEALREFQTEYVPELEKMPGFRGLIVGVNWRGGTACALGLWDSEETMKASSEVAAQARATAQSRGQPGREPIHDDYEVVLEKLPS